MSSTLPRSPAPAAAHAVLNQPPPLEGRNLFTDDVALAEALEREGGARARERLHAAGAFWGGEPMAGGAPRARAPRRAAGGGGGGDPWAGGAQPTGPPPILHTHDRFGERRDEVEF